MGKPANLEGQRFGRLTAIRRIGEGRRPIWLCECECGNKIEALSGNLKSGGTRSCGCQRSLTVRNKPSRLKLEGLRFGRLVVKYAIGRDENGNEKWQCVCDCGNKTAVFTQNLRSGSTQSCGCLQRELTGERRRIRLTTVIADQIILKKAQILSMEMPPQPGHQLYFAYRNYIRIKSTTYDCDFRAECDQRGWIRDQAAGAAEKKKIILSMDEPPDTKHPFYAVYLTYRDPNNPKSYDATFRAECNKRGWIIDIAGRVEANKAAILAMDCPPKDGHPLFNVFHSYTVPSQLSFDANFREECLKRGFITRQVEINKSAILAMERLPKRGHPLYECYKIYRREPEFRQACIDKQRDYRNREREARRRILKDHGFISAPDREITKEKVWQMSDAGWTREQLRVCFGVKPAVIRRLLAQRRAKDEHLKLLPLAERRSIILSADKPPKEGDSLYNTYKNAIDLSRGWGSREFREQCVIRGWIENDVADKKALILMMSSPPVEGTMFYRVYRKYVGTNGDPDFREECIRRGWLRPQNRICDSRDGG